MLEKSKTSDKDYSRKRRRRKKLRKRKRFGWRRLENWKLGRFIGISIILSARKTHPWKEDANRSSSATVKTSFISVHRAKSRKNQTLLTLISRILMKSAPLWNANLSEKIPPRPRLFNKLWGKNKCLEPCLNRIWSILESNPTPHMGLAKKVTNLVI